MSKKHISVYEYLSCLLINNISFMTFFLHQTEARYLSSLLYINYPTISSWMPKPEFMEKYTVEHVKFATCNFRKLEVASISLHIYNFPILTIYTFNGSCQCFCFKIAWAVAKLWWSKVWSVESSLIKSRQKPINPLLWDPFTRGVINLVCSTSSVVHHTLNFCSWKNH